MKLRYIILKGAMLIALGLAGNYHAVAQDAAEITSDKIDTQVGIRTIHTNALIGRDEIIERLPTVSLILTETVYSDESMLPDLCLYIWYLHETPFAIPDGGIILIKLSDDTVFELKNILFASDTIDNEGFYFEPYRKVMHINQAKVLVTPDIIKAISDKGIIKIRTQLQDGFPGHEYFDKEYSTPQFTKGLQERYDLIEAALATRTGDIREGF